MDLHSEDADIVMVQDYAAKQTTIIYPPNTTFPHGVCTVRRAIFTSDCSMTRHLCTAPSFSWRRVGACARRRAAFTYLLCLCNCFFYIPSVSLQSREFIPSMSNFVDDSAGSVYGTGNFLMFEGHDGTGANAKPAFEPGHVGVRGIPCEAWYRKIEAPASNSSFDVQFFFPVNSWLVARENYHRCRPL